MVVPKVTFFSSARAEDNLTAAGCGCGCAFRRVRASLALFSSKKILQYPSHRMFEHIYGALNIVEKIINYTV